MRIQKPNALFLVIFMILQLIPGLTLSSGKNLNVEALTEEYPPYNFSENGKLKGLSVEILEAIFNELKIPEESRVIRILPWARAFHEAQSPNKMNMIFSTTRTIQREHLFKWVGPIVETKVSVFALKRLAVLVAKKEDLKKYKFVAIREDIGHQMLEANGVPKENIYLVNKYELIPEMMEKNRVKFFAYEERATQLLLKKFEREQNDYVPVLTLYQGDLYYAFNKSVSDSVVKAYQDALTSISAKVRAIKSRYSLSQSKDTKK